MLPAPFRSLRVLRGLNIAGVGLALAALTSVVFGRLLGNLEYVGLAAFAVGGPTLLVGLCWAKLLRWRGTFGQRKVRLGWVLSVPLAMVNAALIAGITMMTSGTSAPFSARLASLAMGLVLGATAGAVVWLPSLLATLLLFGVPIAWAQKQAQQGLAGEERGEAFVGATVALLSLTSWVVLSVPNRDVYGPTTPWKFLVPYGICMDYVYIAGALLTGALACGLSWSRERQRRQIVREAEAGTLADFRVDTTEAGKVLVRVTTQGEGYRVSDLDEELFALDQQGRAVGATPARITGRETQTKV